MFNPVVNLYLFYHKSVKIYPFSFLCGLFFDTTNTNNNNNNKNNNNNNNYMLSPDDD